ncbi:proline-rich proteoglycan 2-like [Suncus etruscus]|uniref:proline-rich proteoglycan 2-like n=1 Tax=Suncus etruscus TaxID=109475 RepID=UPI002110CDCD|nr:proline-rich proteoglycan 2-like [Suncus etruscus]
MEIRWSELPASGRTIISLGPVAGTRGWSRGYTVVLGTLDTVARSGKRGRSRYILYLGTGQGLLHVPVKGTRQPTPALGSHPGVAERAAQERDQNDRGTGLRRGPQRHKGGPDADPRPEDPSHMPQDPSHASGALTPQPCHHTRASTVPQTLPELTAQTPPPRQGTRCPAHPPTLHAQKTCGTPSCGATPGHPLASHAMPCGCTRGTRDSVPPLTCQQEGRSHRVSGAPSPGEVLIPASLPGAPQEQLQTPTPKRRVPAKPATAGTEWVGESGAVWGAGDRSPTFPAPGQRKMPRCNLWALGVAGDGAGRASERQGGADGARGGYLGPRGSWLPGPARPVRRRQLPRAPPAARTGRPRASPGPTHLEGAAQGRGGTL